jgi:DNA-binding CsgD family transcriptional regulator
MLRPTTNVPECLTEAARRRGRGSGEHRGDLLVRHRLGSGNTSPVTEAAAAGWEALSRGSWDEALALLGASEDDPEALEAAGVAHWWLDDADETIGAREHAYRLYRERGDRLGAARVAGALAWDSVLFGGRTAVARGWLDRAARLLREEPLSPEHAWLAVREAEVALASGAPAIARVAAQRAISIATELAREDVQVVGRSLEGLSLVHEGLIDEGMRRLDESAVAATAGELDDLMWVGKVCCNLIAACERVGDLERANQWCAEVKEFAQRWELRALFNTCRTQYAAVLLQTGAWTEAEDELQAALAVFTGGRRAALFDGTAQLGELRRRQGRLDEARSLFSLSERSRIARFGGVELALDEGDAVTALALAERLERATEKGRQLDRITVLSLLVRAAVAADRADTAIEASAELEGLADEVGTARARAAAAWAGGESALARGDLEAARRRLEDAVDLFGLCEVPYERARARLALARVLVELGSAKRARAEASAAREAFRELDARRDSAAAARLLAQPLPVADGASPLTLRERQVLAFVAAGRSNREIAFELVVSEHTVHRHVANILRKLGEPTRAAAAARAVRDGLV